MNQMSKKLFIMLFICVIALKGSTVENGFSEEAVTGESTTEELAPEKSALEEARPEAAPKKRDFSYICIRGILFDEEKPLVIINEDLAKEGDVIQDVKILKIGESSVQFECENEIFSKDVGQDCIKLPPIQTARVEKKEIKDINDVKENIKIKFNQIIEKVRYHNIKGAKKFQELRKTMPTKISPQDAAKVIGITLAIVPALYLFLSIVLYKIAKKTDTEKAWFAWIPLANIYLMCKTARKPAWWLLCLIVLSGIIITQPPTIALAASIIIILIIIVIWSGIANACGKSALLGIFIIIPVLNLFLLLYLAFSKSAIKEEKKEEKKDDPKDKLYGSASKRL